MGNLCSQTEEQKRNNKLKSQLQNNRKEDNKVKKLLLLGAGGSGKSTFFKQLRILHGSGIETNEMENTYKEIIYSNIVSGMKTLIEQAEEFTDHDKTLNTAIDPSNQKRADYVIKLDEDNFETQRQEIEDAITHLWKDDGIQRTWDLKSKFQIQDSAAHFFKHINRITEPNYTPTDQDVLLARIRTTGIVDQEFEIKNNRFQVYDVGGQRNERKKWIHCFDGVTGVIFLAALSAYDQTLYEDDKTNRMKEALDLFKQICNSRWFADASMILFLNKQDLFKEKVQKVPITTCFSDYPGAPHDEYESRAYIKEKFESQNGIGDGKVGKKHKQIYTHFTCAIDRDKVNQIFNSVQQTIITANLQRAALI